MLDKGWSGYQIAVSWKDGHQDLIPVQAETYREFLDKIGKGINPKEKRAYSKALMDFVSKMNRGTDTEGH